MGRNGLGHVPFGMYTTTGPRAGPRPTGPGAGTLEESTGVGGARAHHSGTLGIFRFSLREARGRAAARHHFQDFRGFLHGPWAAWGSPESMKNMWVRMSPDFRLGTLLRARFFGLTKRPSATHSGEGEDFGVAHCARGHRRRRKGRKFSGL